MNNGTFQNLPLFLLLLGIFTLVIFKSSELGYVPLDEKTKQNIVLSDVIPGKPEVASRIKQT